MLKGIPVSGNPVIDDGHRELARRIAEIGQMWKLGADNALLEARVRDFREVAQRHFDREMVIIRALGVAANDHGEEHFSLVAEIDSVLERVAQSGDSSPWADLVDALERMLFDHEILEDSQYFDAIAKQALVTEGTALVVWGTELELGVGWIDRHHRSLVKTLNEIGRLGTNHDESEASSLLDRLRRHAWHHFHDEECRLAASEQTREHVLQHRRLLAELDELIVQVREKTVDLPSLARDYLRYWLIDHIKGSDRRDFAARA